VAFLAGLFSILVALQSGVDSLDDQLLSVHMVQHVILLEIAPVLLLAGRPTALALGSLPTSPRRRLGRLLSRARRLTMPFACLGVFFVVVLGTHLPAFYNATLSQPLLHDAEHLLYLIAGVLMWWPVLGDDPASGRRLNGFLQLVYVIVAMLPMELIGAFLSRQPTLFYAAYRVPSRSLGISAVIDQQHAGAIMWVAGGTVMVAVVLWSAMRALIEEDRRQQVRDHYAGEMEPSKPAAGGRAR
jgi:cytochrome c oxidase assembly factor CtaG